MLTPEPSREIDRDRRRLVGAAAISFGAAHPDAASYAKMFSGRYEHRVIKGGFGHNLPQEAPKAFAEAIIAVGRA